MKQRLQMLDHHAKPSTPTPAPASKPSGRKPTLDIWESMNLDDNISTQAVAFRKATGKMMDDCYDQLEKHVDDTSFPYWIIDKFRALKVNGLNIKGFGSPGLTTLEAGAIIFELGKRDGSIATFFLVHNAIGMAVVDVLGDEEQRKRLLTPAMNFDRMLAFGLTEPNNGSDAS